MSWLGRWTSCDPVGRKDGNNLYVYVHNNVTNKIDPTGTQSKPEPQEVVFPAALITVLKKKKRSNLGIKNLSNLKIPDISPLTYQPFLPDTAKSGQTWRNSPNSLLFYLKGGELKNLSYDRELLLENFRDLPYEYGKEILKDVLDWSFLSNLKYLSNVKNIEGSGEASSSMPEYTTIGDISSRIKKYGINYIGKAVSENIKLSPEYKLFVSEGKDFAKKNLPFALIVGIPLVLALNYSGTDLLPDVVPEFTSWETNRIGEIALGFGNTYLPLGNKEDYFRFTISMTFKDINNLSLGATFSIDPFSDVFGIVGGATMKLEF